MAGPSAAPHRCVSHARLSRQDLWEWGARLSKREAVGRPPPAPKISLNVVLVGLGELFLENKYLPLAIR